MLHVQLLRGALGKRPALYAPIVLRREVARMMQTLCLRPEVGLSVYVANARHMLHLNSWYRRRTTPCDSLSFPHFQDDHASPTALDATTNGSSECDYYLGDIVLCPRRIQLGRDQRGRGEWAEQHRVRTLLAHHLLHLLGYDHHTPRDFRTMRQMELRLLQHGHIRHYSKESTRN